jgi:hypothetical protein
MSIPKLASNFKTYIDRPTVDTILIILAVILAGCGGFLLGIQSQPSTGEIRIRESNMPSLAIGTYAQEQIESISEHNEGSIDYISIVVASKNGTKYYHPDCGGVNRIKEENKIYFPSSKEAREAGYEPAANCKNLE